MPLETRLIAHIYTTEASENAHIQSGCIVTTAFLLSMAVALQVN
jgi:hypothetical protein